MKNLPSCAKVSLQLLFPPEISKTGDTLPLFGSKEERFHIPGQRIQIQFPEPLFKLPEKFKGLRSTSRRSRMDRSASILSRSRPEIVLFVTIARSRSLP